MTKEERHRALVGEIQRLIQIYDTLTPEVKKEILRFIKTPEMTTNINIRFKRILNPKTSSQMQIINYYVV